MKQTFTIYLTKEGKKLIEQGITPPTLKLNLVGKKENATPRQSM